MGPRTAAGKALTTSAAHLYQETDTPKARATCSSSRTLTRPRPNLERLTSHTVRKVQAARPRLRKYDNVRFSGQMTDRPPEPPVRLDRVRASSSHSLSRPKVAREEYGPRRRKKG